MKLQTELDLRNGALSHIEIEPGRVPDGAVESARRATRPRFVANHRSRLFQPGSFRRDDGSEGVLSLPFAVSHGRRASHRRSASSC